MQTLIIGKELLLRTIIGVPTGNNVTRGKNPFDTLVLFSVVKVNRKYISLEKIDSAGYIVKVCLNPNGKAYSIPNDNSGYIFFETMEEITKMKEIKQLAEEIDNKFPYRSSWENLSHEKISKIAAILELPVDTE